LVMEDQYGTYTSRFAALEEQLQDRMAQWTSDHLAELKDDVKKYGNQIRQQVHTACQSPIVGLTDANRSSIDALKVKFLHKMAGQIKEALMEEKREFHSLVMDTFTISHNHLKRSSSYLNHVAAELRRRKTCKSGTQILDNDFHTSPATMNPSLPTHGPPTSTVDTHTVSPPTTSSLHQLLAAHSPLDNARWVHLQSHTHLLTTQTTTKPPTDTPPLVPVTSASTNRVKDPQMRCSEVFLDSAGGSFHNSMQDTTGGTLVTRVVTRYIEKKTSDSDLEARDDTVKDSHRNGVCTESGKFNRCHEFLSTWRHGFAATPEDYTPYSLTCQSTPHSKPHLDNEYPHSFSCDRHPAAAKVV
jgi:hypothetical protein